MQEFNTIREAARKKRDAAIRKARDEYAETLVRIAALEQDLLGRDPSTHKTIASCIERAIPSDRTFTTADIMAGLEAIDGGRVWRKRSVDNHLSRLRDKGLVVRISRAKGTEPAVYARADLERESEPFEGLTLTDAIERVMGGREMTATEVAVALLEAGYQTTMDRKALRNTVARELRAGASSEPLCSKRLAKNPGGR